MTHQAGIYVGEAGYDKIYNSIGLVPNLGVGSKGKARSTTQSAISDGILTVDGKKLILSPLIQIPRIHYIN